MNEESTSAFPSQDESGNNNSVSASGLKQESAKRIFQLLQFLLANECTRKDVFERLACYYRMDTAEADGQNASRRANRMFERDIKFLEGQDFEIKKVKARGLPTRYSLVKGSGPRATFLFTSAEIESLAFLYNLFADPTRYTQIDPNQPLPPSPRNPFAEEIVTLIEKLVMMLPGEEKQSFDHRVRKPYMYFNISPVADYLPHRDTIDTITRAISHRQRIQFSYASTRNKLDITFHQDIDPYYIVYMEGHFYLIGYSHAINQFLEYRIDRVKPESLKMQPDMIDVERRRRPVEFSFWIDSNIAKRGLSQRWLTQTIEREEVVLDEQGRERRRVLVRATAYNEWRVIQQLLRYGDKAELIEPPQLREKMRATVKNMLHYYE